MRRPLVSLALALTFAFTSFAPGALAASRGAVAYELPDLGPGGGAGIVFADALQQAAGWTSTNAAALRLDDAGNVRNLQPGQSAERVVYSTEAYPAGDYTLLYDGNGSFAVEGGSIVASAPGRATVRVPANAGAGLALRLTATDASNPARNVRLVLPGYESTYATQPFVSPFVRSLLGRQTLGFANWMHADTFADSTFWTQRPRVGRATQVSPIGVAPEYMILLANLTGANPWFTLPVGATDGYVANFAALVHRTLDPRLHPAFQYGGEVWNPATPGNAYARMAARNVGIRGDATTAALGWYTRRSLQVLALVTAAFGPDAARVVRVLSGPLPGSTRSAGPLDTYLLQSTSAAIDAFAVPVEAPGDLSRLALAPHLQAYGYVTHAAPAQTVPVTAQVPANAHLVLGTDLPAPPERRGAPRTAPAPGPVALNAPATLDLHGRSGVTGALGVPLAAIQPQSEGTLDWLTVRGGAVAARKSASSPQLRLQTSADGSVSLSVPATTRERTLRVYVTADRAQGTLTATLGDSTFSDSSFEATGGARKGVYTLVYRGTAAGQVLNVRVATSASFGGTVAVAAAALTDVVPVQPPVDQTQYHNDISRSGWNPNESILTPASVSGGGFKELQTLAVDGNVLAQPLYLANYSIAGGVHNVLVVATENDSVYEFDADSGTQLNKVSLGKSQSSGDVGCGDISPTYGITSTPLINRSTGTIYVVAATEPTTSNFHTTLHALSIATLTDQVTPVEITASTTLNNGSKLNFNPQNNYNRAGLVWANNSLYIGVGSHCDNDSSQISGWVLRYNSSLTQLSSFSTIGDPTGDCAGASLSSVWMAGFAPAFDLYGNLYVATGNGAFDASSGGHDYGESVLQLKPDLSAVTSYFTPSNYNALNCSDGDLGSGGVMLVPSPFAMPQSAVAMGKGSTLYVLNSATLGGYTANNSGAMQVINDSGGGVWGGPTYYSGATGQFVYYQTGGDYLHAYAVSYANGSRRPIPAAGTTGPPDTAPTATLTLSSTGTSGAGYGGSTPVVSSNGQMPHTGVVWVVRRGSGTLYLEAYDALNVATLLFHGTAGTWSNGENNGFVTPLVANGKVYVPGTNAITVFGL